MRIIFLLPYLVLLPFTHVLGDEPGTPSTAASPASEFSASAAVDFVKTHCLDCHSASDPEAGLDLEVFSSAGDVAEEIEQWNKIADRVYAGQMPPPESEAPPLELRKSFVNWIRQSIHAAVCDDGVSPGGSDAAAAQSDRVCQYGPRPVGHPCQRRSRFACRMVPAARDSTMLPKLCSFRPFTQRSIFDAATISPRSCVEGPRARDRIMIARAE